MVAVLIPWRLANSGTLKDLRSMVCVSRYIGFSFGDGEIEFR
jgi:hypothetical protein